jgi:predicted TIM-barrel fold metal-dependent hydrolase
MNDDMQIIDPHHHLWDLTAKKHDWLLNEGQMRSYLIEDYLAEIQRQNVIKSVHLQAGWEREDSAGETAWLQSIADKHGFPHGIIAYANLAQNNVEEMLAAHCQYKNTRGIRQIVNWHEDPFYSGCDKNYIEDFKWQKNYGLLQKYNLSFDMQVYPMQMPTAAQIAKKYPGIQMIINHAGMPLGSTKEDFTFWKNSMAALAIYPNVAVKISGFGMLDNFWNVESIRPYVETTIELFGVERCMFASNFPVDKLYSDYDQLFTAYKEITNSMSLSEKQMLFCKNAARIYRL